MINLNIKNKNNFLKRGFTIVESLVAIGILSLSILATFTSVAGSLQLSSTSKDQITAFFLAQEGMESIRNIIDNNTLSYLAGGGNDWLDGISELNTDPCWFGTGKICSVDSTNGILAFCGLAAGSCPYLNQDSVSGKIGYDGGWTPTNFKREIRIASINANEIMVFVNMSWVNHGVTKSIEVTENFFNIQ